MGIASPRRVVQIVVAAAAAAGKISREAFETQETHSFPQLASVFCCLLFFSFTIFLLFSRPVVVLCSHVFGHLQTKQSREISQSRPWPAVKCKSPPTLCTNAFRIYWYFDLSIDAVFSLCLSLSLWRKQKLSLVFVSLRVSRAETKLRERLTQKLNRTRRAVR